MSLWSVGGVLLVENHWSRPQQLGFPVKLLASPMLSPVLYPDSKEGMPKPSPALSDEPTSAPSKATIGYRIKIRFTSWVLGALGA